MTKDNNKNVESTVYGTVVVDSAGNKYVKLDGSDQLTPLSDDERPVADSTTTNANEGERVSVLIKNHTATVTGNVSSPAARSGDVEELGDQVSKIQEFDILIGEQIQAQEGYIQQLQADKANVSDLIATEAKITELDAKKATIAELEAVKATVDSLDATKIDADIVNAKFVTIEGDLEAINADFDNLEADYGDFKEVTTNTLTAYDASITRLETEKLSADQADLKYANIDFSNIGEAAVEKLFADSGIIKDLVVSEGHITGELVGVTIKGDLIEGGTVVADKLVILGEDGLYYKLNTDGITTEAEQTEYNSLSGNVITAKSITAEKVNVNDLVAFDATIGGFTITGNSLYSGVKESIDNTTVGVYLGSDAQVAIGDETNFIKFYKDETGAYRLDISAARVLLSGRQRNVEDVVDDVSTKLDETKESLSSELDAQKEDYQSFLTKFSKYIRFMEDENGDPSDTALTIGSGDSAITLELDNEAGIVFKKGGSPFGWWDGEEFHTGNIVVEVSERAQFGNFAYVPRSDGSLSFVKVKHNTGFYASYRYGVLYIYSAYPTVEETTMVITDIPAELNETTLILGG